MNAIKKVKMRFFQFHFLLILFITSQLTAFAVGIEEGDKAKINGVVEALRNDGVKDVLKDEEIARLYDEIVNHIGVKKVDSKYLEEFENHLESKFLMLLSETVIASQAQSNTRQNIMVLYNRLIPFFTSNRLLNILSQLNKHTDTRALSKIEINQIFEELKKYIGDRKNDEGFLNMAHSLTMDHLDNLSESPLTLGSTKKEHLESNINKFRSVADRWFNIALQSLLDDEFEEDLFKNEEEEENDDEEEEIPTPSQFNFSYPRIQLQFPVPSDKPKKVSFLDSDTIKEMDIDESYSFYWDGNSIADIVDLDFSSISKLKKLHELEGSPSEQLRILNRALTAKNKLDGISKENDEAHFKNLLAYTMDNERARSQVPREVDVKTRPTIDVKMKKTGSEDRPKDVLLSANEFSKVVIQPKELSKMKKIIMSSNLLKLMGVPGEYGHLKREFYEEFFEDVAGHLPQHSCRDFCESQISALKISETLFEMTKIKHAAFSPHSAFKMSESRKILNNDLKNFCIMEKFYKSCGPDGVAKAKKIEEYRKEQQLGGCNEEVKVQVNREENEVKRARIRVEIFAEINKLISNAESESNPQVKGQIYNRVLAILDYAKQLEEGFLEEDKKFRLEERWLILKQMVLLDPTQLNKIETLIEPSGASKGKLKDFLAADDFERDVFNNPSRLSWFKKNYFKLNKLVREIEDHQENAGSFFNGAMEVKNRRLEERLRQDSRNIQKRKYINIEEHILSKMEGLIPAGGITAEEFEREKREIEEERNNKVEILSKIKDQKIAAEEEVERKLSTMGDFVTSIMNKHYIKKPKNPKKKSGNGSGEDTEEEEEEEEEEDEEEEEEE